MAKNYTAAAAAAPLSRSGVLVAQLESIVASAVHKSPEPLLCFDLLSDLISAIDEDTKVSLSLSTFHHIALDHFFFFARSFCHIISFVRDLIWNAAGLLVLLSLFGFVHESFCLVY